MKYYVKYYKAVATEWNLGLSSHKILRRRSHYNDNSMYQLFRNSDIYMS